MNIWEEHTDILDPLLGLLYLILIMVGARVYQQNKINPIYNFFSIGLFCKILGAILFGITYHFYYKGGDTIYYFKGGRVLFDLFTESPILYIKALFTEAGDHSTEFYSYTSQIPFFKNTEGWLMARLTSGITILSFGRYYPATIILSTISFIGLWKFLLFFNGISNGHNRYLPYFILFAPSVIFWGGGILKDTICIAALGYLSYYVDLSIRKKQKILQSIIICTLSGYLLIELKAYIIISFVPCALYWIYLIHRESIKHPLLKFIMGPVLFLMFIGFGYYLIDFLTKTSTFYNIDSIESRVRGFQNWHDYLSERDGQSGYSLGEIDYTFTGVLAKFIPATIVGLFRPFLWEVSKVVQILSALENFMFLSITIYVISIKKLKVLSNIHLRFFFLFSILFAFIVGFTSYNFGALVRYKIPLLPFYGAFLAISLSQILNKKQLT